MNEPHPARAESAGTGQPEPAAALFLDLVAQFANMALIFLGRLPHPETGQSMQDLESAQMFIERLEMLEAKTKGNLTKGEEALLKQSLMTVRMAFVEAVEKPLPGAGKPDTGSGPTPAESGAAESTPPSGAPAAGQPEPAPSDAQATAAEAEARKKFVKRY